MLRYGAVLAAGLLLSVTFADSLAQSRDDNLLLIDTSCLLVVVNSNSHDMPTAEQDITTTITNKALLYGVPVKTDCTANDWRDLPALLMSFTTLDTAFEYSLAVVLPRAAWAPPNGAPHFFTDATVWEHSGIGARISGINAQDLKDKAAALFDNFALAWKKWHQQ